jgi:hypothetical protein
MSASDYVVHHFGRDGHEPTADDWIGVLRLAKARSGTVGFLPDEAFSDRLRAGRLIVIKLGDEIVGYCLYDLPRAGYIKLVHVCVSVTARGSRLGKRMVDAVISINPNAIGVLAYCRRDYRGLDRFWSSVGLTPRSERPGRAVKGSILSAWWRPLGALDLIDDAALGSGQPVVVLDTNVVSDLYASPSIDRPERDASQALAADWLQAAITSVVSPWLDFELNKIEDVDERRRQQSASQDLVRLRSKLSEDDTTLERLLHRVGDSELTADSSLSDDLHHVADAVDSDAAFLVTNDLNLIRVAEAALEGWSTLRLVRPHQLVLEILRRTEQPVFQSRFIESVDLAWQPAADHPIETIVSSFTNHGNGERGKDLARQIRSALANHPRSTRVLVDTRGRIWALLAESNRGAALTVELLRVARVEAASTVALQLARHLRETARNSQLTDVRITDSNVAPLIQRALEQDGYTIGTEPRATLIDGFFDAQEFHRSRGGAETPSVAQVRAYERTFWPLILKASAVPTVIIPIRPVWSERLFGIDLGGLWQPDRKRALGLSREHVYYSGSDKALPAPGCRILWYVSSDKTTTVRQIMAYSRSLGCERMTPELAHATYSKVGAWSAKDVKDTADKRRGMVTVVRFEDTEVLDNPIGGVELQELFRDHVVGQPVQSFRNVAPALFDEVIRRQPRSSQ